MSADVSRYPLSWPRGWKRTLPYARQAAKFGKRVNTPGQSWRPLAALTVADALTRLLDELSAIGVRSESVVISTNVPTRLDGLPYSNAREPGDPGVAVYFTLRGAPRVLACDRYTKVAGNLAAIAAHVDAIRAIERYGVGSLEQAFAGYAALPPEAGIDWHVVLDVSPTAPIEEIEAAYRRKALEAHPDRGGSTDTMTRINVARDAARRARGAA